MIRVPAVGWSFLPFFGCALLISVRKKNDWKAVITEADRSEVTMFVGTTQEEKWIFIIRA